MTKRLLKITLTVLLISFIIFGYLIYSWIVEISLLRSTYTAATSSYIAARCVSHPIIKTEIQYTEPNLKYLGNYKLTYYCACAKCCGKTNGITASGAHVQANHTIAVDPSVIPLGSQVLINGIIYTAEDTGGSIKEKRIDIYVETHEEALHRGVSYADVYLLN